MTSRDGRDDLVVEEKENIPRPSLSKQKVRERRRRRVNAVEHQY